MNDKMKLSIAKISSEKSKLLSAKTPEQYISLSINSKLPQRKKAIITSEWLAKTNYTYDDIVYARNRHPFWKKKKSAGSAERNVKRMEEFNYKKAGEASRKKWSIQEIGELFDLDKKFLDRDLAKKFQTSLPAINHIRRKFKMTCNILTIKKEKLNKKKIISYSMKGEKILRQELISLSK
jgi:hypothetical protein